LSLVTVSANPGNLNELVFWLRKLTGKEGIEPLIACCVLKNQRQVRDLKKNQGAGSTKKGYQEDEERKGQQ